MFGSLADARIAREAARKLIKQGLNPRGIKTGDSFTAIAKEWHNNTKAKWTQGYSAMIWQRLEDYLIPDLGHKSIRDIKPREVLDCIRKVEKLGHTEISHRVHQHANSVFRYAIACDKADYNPAGDLQGALKPHVAKHLPTISAKELPDFFKALKAVDTSLLNKLAIEFMMLTFVRSGELRYAEWKHINFKAKQWEIPAEIMKMPRDHIVPLSRQAIGILKHIKTIIPKDSRYIFPAQQKRKHPVMSENTINKVIAQMGYKGKLVGHGFRSLASTTLHEMGLHSDAIERQLAHVEGNKIKAAYNRALYIKERAEIMQVWADFLEKQKRVKKAA